MFLFKVGNLLFRFLILPSKVFLKDTCLTKIEWSSPNNSSKEVCENMDLDSEFPVAFNMLIMVFCGEESCAFCLSHCQFLFHNLPRLVANFN